jgi:sulfide:quinone oxidoreductase
MADDRHRSRDRVLIVGGGIGGIEAALALRDLAGDRLEVEIRDPRRQFVFRPFAVGEPYGAARIFRYDLDKLARLSGALFHPDGIVSVAAGERKAVTRDGERLSYDHLVLATGARMLWSVPGAITFWGAADEGQVGEVVARLRSGALRRLVFTMPGGCGWGLPLYELALLGATELSKAGVSATRLTVVTPEDAPLELFGREAAEQTKALLDERGIEVIASAHPVKFDDGRLHVAPGGQIEADAVISLPRLEGRRIGGVPHDADGFVAVDDHGAVIGRDRLYAVGDATSFPVKQGGIATQQADAVAEAIAATLDSTITPKPFDPVLRGVLWTGKGPRYLYGRPTGGHGEGASRMGERPAVPGQNGKGKVFGRYLTPFLESLAGDTDSVEALQPTQTG